LFCNLAVCGYALGVDYIENAMFIDPNIKSSANQEYNVNPRRSMSQVDPKKSSSERCKLQRVSTQDRGIKEQNTR
jgi:hypothetical protein